MTFEIFWSVDLKCEKESSDEWQITLDNMKVGKNGTFKAFRTCRLSSGINLAICSSLNVMQDSLDLWKIFRKFQTNCNGKFIKKKDYRIIYGTGSILGVCRKEES